MTVKSLFMCLTLFLFSSTAPAVEDRVELETTFIKGNKELPQVLYIVPWKDSKKARKKQEVIVLHSLFGEIFIPVVLNERHLETTPAAQKTSRK